MTLGPPLLDTIWPNRASLSRRNGISQPQAVGHVEGLDPNLNLLLRADLELPGH